MVVSHRQTAGQAKREYPVRSGLTLDALPKPKRQGNEECVEAEDLRRSGVVPHDGIGTEQGRGEKAGRHAARQSLRHGTENSGRSSSRNRGQEIHAPGDARTEWQCGEESGQDGEHGKPGWVGHAT